MKLHKAVPLLAAIVIGLLSCSKEKSYETSALDNAIYLPHNTGSFWHYQDTVQHTGFTLTATDRVDSIDKIRFYYYQNVTDGDPRDTSYTLIGKAGYNYYISALLPELGSDKLMILQQDGGVGETWTQSISYDSSPKLDLLFKIVGKGTSRTVLGETFDHVIQVSVAVKIPLHNSPGTGSTLSVPVGNIYFAAHVGIIEISLEMEEEAVHLLLTDYDIR